MLQKVIDWIYEHLWDRSVDQLCGRSEKKRALKTLSSFLHIALRYFHQVRLVATRQPITEKHILDSYIFSESLEKVNLEFITHYNRPLFEKLGFLKNSIKKELDNSKNHPVIIADKLTTHSAITSYVDCLEDIILEIIFCMIALNNFYKIRYSSELLNTHEKNTIAKTENWKLFTDISKSEEKKSRLSKEFADIESETIVEPKWKLLLSVVGLVAIIWATVEASIAAFTYMIKFAYELFKE